MDTATRIGRYCREKIISEIRKHYDDTKQVIFIEFEKLDAFSVNLLRNDLREKNARIIVSKNTLIRKALEGVKNAIADNEVQGSTGLVFLSGDPIDACKLLADFAKEKENFKIKGGILDEQKIDEKAVKALAKMPSRDVLRGMCVNALASVLTNCVGVLNNVITQAVLVIKAVQEKKEKAQ